MTLSILDTSHLTSFSSEGPLPTPLLNTDQVRALLLNLEAGQSVSPCQMTSTVLYYVIEGQGNLRVKEERGSLQTGSLAVVPPGATRSISAETRMRVLAIQAQ